VPELKTRQVTHFLTLLVLVLALLSVAIPHGTTQTSQDVTDLSYRAFSEIAQVYRSGGQAGDLVTKLNEAIHLTHQSRVESLTGNQTGASALDEKARSIIDDVLTAIPAAQQKAQSQSQTRTITVIALIPLAVVISTFAFVVALRIWRDYERSKLYEMRIVEDKARD
jgi:hypothetical protein